MQSPAANAGRGGTSFDESALLVKSLQHELKHRSTKFEYMRMKSCICIATNVSITREDRSRLRQDTPASSQSLGSYVPARRGSSERNP